MQGGRSLVAELGGSLAIAIRTEANPVRTESIRELKRFFLRWRNEDLSILDPRAGAGQVDFDANVHGLRRVVRKSEGLAVVTRQQIGIGRDADFRSRILPRAADAARFA